MELVLIIVVLGAVAVLALTAVGRDLTRANRERNARAASAHGLEPPSDRKRDRK